MSNIKKPKKINRLCYDYHDIISFISQKHKIDIDLDCQKFENISFWNWLLANEFFDVENGAQRMMSLRVEKGFEDVWNEQPNYVNQILKLIDIEFPEEDGKINVIVNWSN